MQFQLYTEILRGENIQMSGRYFWKYGVLLLACCFVTTDAQQIQPYGDIQLVCSDIYKTNQEDNRGQIKVYQPELQEYLSVCLNNKNGFNRGAAAAVCRQLGFVDAEFEPTEVHNDHFGPPDIYGCDRLNTPRYISHILCPNVSNYVTDGELHAMRCSVGNVTERCEDNRTVALSCTSEELKNASSYRYDGQVHLSGNKNISYSGTAQIRVSDKYYPMCSDSFDSEPNTAKSICRQLGYTSGFHKTSLNTTEPTFQFSDVACNTRNGSFPCFSHCFNDYSIVKTCNQTEIFCDFKVEDIGEQSAGNRLQCKFETQPCVSECNYASAIVWTIFACVVIAAIGAPGVMCCYCKRKMWKLKIKNCCHKYNDQITRPLTEDDKKGYS